MNKMMKILLICLFFVSIFMVEYASLVSIPLFSANFSRTLIGRTNERYLSVCIDTSLLEHKWRGFDFKSKKLQTLAAGLAPAYLRFGGTAADYFIFTHNSTQNGLDKPPTKNFTMGESDISAMYDWVEWTGLRFLLDLNVLLRRGDAWEPNNTMELLTYLAETGRMGNLDLELGNEPNSFRHTANISIPASQLSRDFMTLQKLIRSSPRLNASCHACRFVGPDANAFRPHDQEYDGLGIDGATYLTDYLTSLNGSIDAITWHHYYDDGRKATLSDYTSSRILDSLQKSINSVRTVVNATGYHDTPVWLGETSSSYGGGAPGLSNTYANGFRWLDKLGLCAANNLSVLMRQSFIRGHYALISEYEYEPYPDYWLSLLYKRLVGSDVLSIHVNDARRNVRLYAHCAAYRSGYPAGSLVMYGMNLYPHAVNVTIGDQITSDFIDVYQLTPRHGDLQATDVKLNGRLLQMVDNTTLPALYPLRISRHSTLHLKSFSFAFFVYANAHVETCRTDNKHVL